MLKPFDLEKALAGEPVVLRDGTPVLKVIDSGFPIKNPILALWKGRDTFYSYSKTGNYSIHSGTDSPFDLFMAHKTTTLYVNLYQYEKSPRSRVLSLIFATKEEAESNRVPGGTDVFYPSATRLATAIPISVQS